MRGRSVGVDGLDLDVPVGGVHGFLGPNGSGKTTTIRMLLGLARPDSGTMRIFGHEVPGALPLVVGRVGAIVEQPKFFPSFTGRRNLELLAGAIGAEDRMVGTVLAEVGLSERSRDRYRGYSLGMKQRLAIAATLLKDPDLLIFDEPTNGLDPAGIREIRETMRGLGERGKTVLVSSHILAEVAQVADTVSIIGRGRLLAQGSVDEIVGRQSGSVVRVGIEAPDRAVEVLRAAGLTARVDAGVVLVDGVEDASEVTRVLAGSGLFVRDLTTLRADLESVFLELTAGERPGGFVPDDGPGSGADGSAARGPGAAEPAPLTGSLKAVSKHGRHQGGVS
ncbi:ABC transporter ATP-binding protein [Paraoerskovia sediminicola]|uniref:ABC transporter ATP-binding protein n=1 Tax=Paraoerskovia sediminicola TaxID=1138587 RepID=UPI0025729DD2|nr:ABC transporter ATP-binding protein [Paraoerskovia sediminicola]